MQNSINLKPSDFKLLSYLYHSNREPLTKIAKATHLSREQVEYKIRNYLSLGLIRKFFPVVDYTTLGYNVTASLLLKFDNPSSAKEYVKTLKSNQFTISYGVLYAKYDLYINCIFKDDEELNKYLSSILSNKFIIDHTIIKPYFAAAYPLKQFNEKNGNIYLLHHEQPKKVKLDEKELQLLKLLCKNSRARIIDLATEMKISSELVVYKIRKLQKEKVLKGSRIEFDMEKIGYFFTILLLDIKNFSASNQEKIKQFAKNSPHINNLLITASKPNCHVQLFYKSESELRETITALKELFKESLVDYEIMPANQEEKDINPLPFL